MDPNQNPQEANTPIPQKQKSPLDKLKALAEKLKTVAEKALKALNSGNKRLSIQKPESSPEGTQVEGAAAQDFIDEYKTEPPQGWFQKHRTKIIAAGIVLLGIFIVRGCMTRGKAKQPLEQLVSQEQGQKEQVIPVKGFKIGRFNFEDSHNALGTIKGAMEFKLSFEIPGVISSINYREGERYDEGALLISLRQDDILLRLKRAQAEANKHQTTVQIAEEKVKEHEKLFSLGAITKTALEKAQLELDQAKYEAEASRLEVKSTEAILEKSNLYAPSSGMIGQLNIEEGETITSNTLLGSHIMTEYVYAEFGVVEREVNKIALGQKAKVFIDAYPDKTFEGVIENISPVVAGTSRTASARIRIENPDGQLLPGMFARIRILLYSKKNTLIVPTDAVQGKEGEHFVFVVISDKGIVEKRPITVGYTRPDYSQIDAGISEGEVVAVTGLEKLEDGKKIRLLETQQAEV